MAELRDLLIDWLQKENKALSASEAEKIADERIANALEYQRRNIGHMEGVRASLRKNTEVSDTSLLARASL